MDQTVSLLCKGGCGYFGSPENENFCSKCYKEETEKKQQIVTESRLEAAVQQAQCPPMQSVLRKRRINDVCSSNNQPGDLVGASPTEEKESSAPVVELPSIASPPEASQPEVSQPIPITQPPSDSLGPAALDIAASAGSGPPLNSKIPRCSHRPDGGKCRGKSSLGFPPCPGCEKFYCAMHRLPHDHECPHDFKTEGRERLAKDNPVVTGSKVPII